jgi:hypothetical protein
MADFNLEIDAPYPAPDEDLVFAKPQKMEYKKGELKHKHYGRNIEFLIKAAIKMENEDEKKAAITYIGKLMKSFYASWNRENISDDVIVRHLYEMSEQKIDMRDQLGQAETLFNISNFKEKGPDRNDHSNHEKRSRGGGGGKRRRRRR